MLKIFFKLLILLLFTKGSTSFMEVAKTEKRFALSIAEMNTLLEMETSLINSMTKYANAMKEKFQIIQNAANEMQIENNKSRLDPEKYLGNPLKSFSLIRRMHTEWSNWLEYMLNPFGKEFIENMQEILERKPTLQDLQDAVEGMQRIQFVYALQPDDMAKGLLNGIQYDGNLTKMDLFSIGEELHKMGFIADAMGWLETALRAATNEGFFKEIFSIDESQLYKKYKNMAIESNQNYKPLIKIQSAKRRPNTEVSIASFNDERIKNFNLKLATLLVPNISPTKMFKAYSNICRGRLRHLRALHCHFLIFTNIFLPNGILQVEILSTTPFVALFHNVLREKEISDLKKLTHDRLVPAKTYLQSTDPLFSDYNGRTAKAYKLETNSFLNKLHDFLVMNGLEGKGFELPQIINYGIGGHQNLHVDFIHKECNMVNRLYGNRMATLMFYLTDVEQGGATVFPFLNLFITPRKGSALLWFNIHNNGTPNFNTMHSSCPVIVGSKWIFTTWISERAP